MQCGNLIPALKQEKSELLVYVFFIKECYFSRNKKLNYSHKQQAAPSIEKYR